MNENMRNAHIAFGMESSFGTNEKAYDPFQKYKGGMQIGPETQQKYNLADIQILSSNEKSREIYMLEVKERTENTTSNGNWLGWEINKRAENLGIETGLLEYISWQQGRGGTIDIITAALALQDPDQSAYSMKARGTFDEKQTRENILNQFPADMREEKKKIKDPKQLAKDYLDYTKIKWEVNKEESKRIKQLDMQEGVMDLNEDIFK